MEFRQRGQRDDRRRRVLAEDAAGTLPTPAARRAREGKVPSYTAAARPDHQRRLTDLVPVRARTHVLLAAVGGLLVAGLLAAFYATNRPDCPLPAELWPAFDLSGRSSLATWFRSALLAAAGMTAIMIYLVRRHKSDDYRGRYRLWLWGAMCCWVASADATAGLSETLARVMNVVGAGPAAGGQAVWQLSPLLLIGLPIGLRLAWDVRSSRLATSVLLLATAAWCTAFGVQQSQSLTLDGMTRVMVQAGCTLAGDLGLCWALTLYARHVLLDAQGLLRNKRRRKDKLTVVSAENAPDANRGDMPSAKPHLPRLPLPTTAPRESTPAATIATGQTSSGAAEQPRAVEGAATRTAKMGLGSFLRLGIRRHDEAEAVVEPDSQEDPDSQEESSSPSRRLSKAERRQLRREQRRAA